MPAEVSGGKKQVECAAPSCQQDEAPCCVVDPTCTAEAKDRCSCEKGLSCVKHNPRQPSRIMASYLHDKFTELFVPQFHLSFRQDVTLGC